MVTYLWKAVYFCRYPFFVLLSVHEKCGEDLIFTSWWPRHFTQKNIDVCKTLMPPFPNMWRVGLTSDLPFDLLLGQSILELSVAQCVGDWHDLWPSDLNINRDHLLIKDYLPTKFEAFEAKRSWVISCISYVNLWAINMTFDLDLWPTYLNINKDHLLILDYLPTKFEACRTKHCWVISCTSYGQSTWPLTLTFDLLTWISKGIIYSSRTIHLPSLKLLGQSVLGLSVAQG